jgi:transposase
MGRNVYTQEYKAEALDLANRKGPAQAAADLGINVNNIHRWRSEKISPKAKGPNEVDFEKENRKLRQENEYLRKINEVLKKSTAIFSQDHHPNSK